MRADYSRIARDGLWGNNVVFAQSLALCPLLAVTGTATNGLGLGLASTFVMVTSAVLVALLRDIITPEVRIPVFVLINLAAGRTSVLPYWRTSGLEQLRHDKLSAWIEQQGVTRALLPPSICETLAGRPVPRNLKTIFTGGGPVFPDVIERLRTRRALQVISVYRPTEAEPIAELNAADVSTANNAAMKSGRELVSASFVTPYPPGFPILVPGQVVSEEILAFMRALDVKEIHGYEPEIGLQLFTEQALKKFQE